MQPQQQQVKTARPALATHSKTEQQALVLDWLAHPVTAALLEETNSKVTVLTNIILEGDTPSIFKEDFLLREQLIGEIRGLKQAHAYVLDIYKQLKDSENPDNEKTSDTVES